MLSLFLKTGDCAIVAFYSVVKRTPSAYWTCWSHANAQPPGYWPYKDYDKLKERPEICDIAVKAVVRLS